VDKKDLTLKPQAIKKAAEEAVQNIRLEATEEDKRRVMKLYERTMQRARELAGPRRATR